MRKVTTTKTEVYEFCLVIGCRRELKPGETECPEHPVAELDTGEREVPDGEGYFHGWRDRGIRPLALIEREDGQVVTKEPHQVKFLDKDRD